MIGRHLLEHVVHPIDQLQLRGRLGTLECGGFAGTDLDIGGALDDEHRDGQSRHLRGRDIAKPGDQVGLHTGPEEHRERPGHLTVEGAPCLEFRQDRVGELVRLGGKAGPDLVADDRAGAARRAGHGDTGIGTGRSRGDHADERPFAVADDRDGGEPGVGPELRDPSCGIIDVVVEAERGLAGEGAGTGPDAALVVAQRCNAIGREDFRELPQAVVPAAEHCRVAVAVGGARAGDEEGDGKRCPSRGYHQRPAEHTGAGVEVHLGSDGLLRGDVGHECSLEGQSQREQVKWSQAVHAHAPGPMPTAAAGG